MWYAEILDLRISCRAPEAQLSTQTCIQPRQADCHVNLPNEEVMLGERCAYQDVREALSTIQSHSLDFGW